MRMISEARPPWFSYAMAVLGNRRYQFEIAKFYCRLSRTKESIKKAVAWCTKSAMSDWKPAQILLSNFYVAGYGVSKDYEQAFYWSARSAELGDLEGLHALAWCYEQGVGTAINYPKAFALWSESARRGLPDSQYAVANCYFKGLGVQSDLLLAQEWCQLAIRNAAHARAKELLQEIQRAITGNSLGSEWTP